ILDPRGEALLTTARNDKDTAIVATVAFATAQFKDTTMIPWFDSLLAKAETAPTVAAEAARGLGMLLARRDLSETSSAAAKTALAKFLMRVPAPPPAAMVAPVGEALLALGRASGGGFAAGVSGGSDNLAPLIKWTSSPNDEIRWRATWALFRPPVPAATEQ